MKIYRFLQLWTLYGYGLIIHLFATVSGFNCRILLFTNTANFLIDPIAVKRFHIGLNNTSFIASFGSKVEQVVIKNSDINTITLRQLDENGRFSI